MTHPLDHVLAAVVQLRSDMTTLANVTCKIRVNGGSATTYTDVSSPPILQNADILYGYELKIPAGTYSDGDVVEATWIYSGTAYAYAVEIIGPAAVDGGFLDVAVSTRLAAADYTAPDNADTAEILAELELVKAKTDLLGTGIVTFGGPVLSATEIELTIGDDYLAEDSRALSWTADDWPDLTDSTITLELRRTTRHGETASFDGTATAPKEIQIELVSADTSDLAAGTWAFAAKATLDNDSEVTLAAGTAVLTARP